MISNYIFIALGWLITIILLILFIPKDKIREAFVVFSFKQILTWLLGLTVVQMGLIEYPIRLFPYANKTSFSFEYFIYPSICAIFNQHYPEKKTRFYKIMYYLFYCTVLTLIEVIVEKHTDILKYIHWSWVVTWVTLLITFFTARKFFTWFYKSNQSQTEKSI